MSTTTIQLTVKQLGKKRPTLNAVPLTLPHTLSATPTLRELIAVIVEQQVTTFNEQRNEPNILPFLQPNELMERAATGKVSFGDNYNKTTVKVQKAIENAWQAYEDGLFLVFIDEQKIELLNDAVSLQSSSQLMFLRLVALVGGYY
ncbi:MAG: hypothetical protein AB8G22_23105 [Saprospiraceae bacterium]